MECNTCHLSNPEIGKELKVYQDDICSAILSKKPASFGHVILYPKKHYIILEQIPDNIFYHLFEVANKISQAMFESLGVGGTNIFIQNGTPAGQYDPHFSIHILGRKENDNVKLDWELKQAPEDQLKSIMNMYKEITDVNVYGKDVNSNKILNKKNNSEDDIEHLDDDSDEENYLIKYWERKP
jgi:histidine triad (HIT) family protein